MASRASLRPSDFPPLNSGGRRLFLVALLWLWVGDSPGQAQTDAREGIRLVTPGPTGTTGFSRLEAELAGIAFTNQLTGDAFLTNVVAHNGSGVALADVDGDGWVDIYFCRLQGPNALYRNQGNWKFEAINPGDAACPDQFSTGAAFADLDGDGDSDLLVNGIAAGTRLFLNDGRGHFQEQLQSGLSRTASATSLALADVDGDRDLDLYCAHYLDVLMLADPTTQLKFGNEGVRRAVTEVNGQPTTLPRWKNRFAVDASGEVRELPEADALYLNEGGGRFRAIQDQPGTFRNETGQVIPPPRDWGLGAMFRDLNHDGRPDLFVANDSGSPNRLWLNIGNASFQLAPAAALRHGSRSSMGVDFADLNRDGQDDFLVLDMLARDSIRRKLQPIRSNPAYWWSQGLAERPQYNRNSLFLGRADGTFAEAALWAGLAATDWSWCPIFLDVDLDGYEDLLVSSGFDQDVLDQDSTDDISRRKWTPEEMRRYRQIHPSWHSVPGAFRNRQDGTFESVASQWGFREPGVSHGMAVADLDNDGDLDVVLNSLNAPAGVYRNNSSAPRIAVRLRGLGLNPEGIGARVRLTSGSFTQEQEVISGGRYLSGDQAIRVFALPPNLQPPAQLEVNWRGGGRSLIGNILPNRIYEIDESSAAVDPPAKPVRPPQFQDASDRLALNARESDFDDWSRQPLLLNSLSREGPALAWYDFNADGWDDLLVTAARGQRMTVLANQEGQSFQLLQGEGQSPGDQSAIVGWNNGHGVAQFLVATSNYELRPFEDSQLTVFSPLAAPVNLPAGTSAIGALEVADLDGDGDLDVFVAGRVLAGRYPEAASSSIWRNEQGQLRLDPEASQPFQNLGLVSGSVLTDLDSDGDPDLALALEWGSVRLFRNQKGRFEALIDPVLSAVTGRWTRLTAGDFDGDGRMDLAVGNLGRNTEAELFGASPQRLYYGRWIPGGPVQLLEAWSDQGSWKPVRDRNFLVQGMPDLLARFPTHRAFSQASVGEILAGLPDAARYLEINTWDSGVFLNRPAGFEWRPFPALAQLTATVSLAVGDLDGDGHQDLFLGQNSFVHASTLTRLDSGQGLWLRGRGNGTFEAQDSVASGLRIEGEQKGCAVGDFNQDGRLDLAVSQNQGPLKLFLNQRAREGLRVLLQGPPGNPAAVGSQLRLKYAPDNWGPAHEVRQGTGSGGQSSVVPVLGRKQQAGELWIRWPGGREQILSVSPDAATVKLIAP